MTTGISHCLTDPPLGSNTHFFYWEQLSASEWDVSDPDLVLVCCSSPVWDPPGRWLSSKLLREPLVHENRLLIKTGWKILCKLGFIFKFDCLIRSTIFIACYINDTAFSPNIFSKPWIIFLMRGTNMTQIQRFLQTSNFSPLRPPIFPPSLDYEAE